MKRFLVLFSILVLPCAAHSYAFPLKASATGQYLIDQNGSPFLMVGDGTAQGMAVMISTTDAATYLADRQSYGFNSIWVHSLWNDGEGGNAGGATFDGLVPFSANIDGTHYDLTKTSAPYWARMDSMISLAATYGMVVLFDTIDWDGWTATFQANGNANTYAFGQFLGNRYKNSPNIIWLTGNDSQTWNTVPGDNALMQNMMAGIASSDTAHLQTTELNYNMSGSLDDTLLVPYTTLTSAYTYYPSYYQNYQEYISTQAYVPVFFIETYYDGVTYGNLTPTTANNSMLRRQAYWSTLSGGLSGYYYGTKWYNFGTGWQAGIDLVSATQLTYWKNLMTSIPWYTLVPDNGHTVTTAGYGTATGNNAGNIQTDNYVTTAKDAAGTLALVYCSTGTTLTIDMTKFQGYITGVWYDPTNGKYSTISKTPFANASSLNFATPGINSAGDYDWMLILSLTKSTMNGIVKGGNFK